MFEFFVRNKAFAGGLGLAEDLARWFFQQLIIALDFTHKKGIANRDIKLEVRGLDQLSGFRSAGFKRYKLFLM